MPDMHGPNAPSGWYPDPDMTATERYWDGENWTDHRAPAQSTLKPDDELPTPPRPGPGATIACIVGVLAFVLGWLLWGDPLSVVLMGAGAVTVGCSWLYAHMRDARQAENLADEYLARRNRTQPR